MATGRSNFLTKQAGEYLVAAELSRRGYIATTFTGNLPDYDIVAVDDSGGHALVQVKAVASGRLQVNVGDFANIVFDGHRQIVRGIGPEPCPGLIYVLVQLAPAGSGLRDRFFVLPWRELAKVVVDLHTRYLERIGGIRPKKWDSLHGLVRTADVADWEGKWDVLMERVDPMAGQSEARGTTV